MSTSLIMTTPNANSAKSIKRLLRQSVRAIRTNQFDDAIRFINEVIERQPDNVRAHALKFSTYYISKQFEKARKIGSKAAELNPKSEYIVNNQACLELGVGKAKEAQKLLNALIEESGDKPQWLYNLALSYDQLGDLEIAIETFNRVLDIQPDHHKALLQKTSVELKLGLHEDAFQTLNILRLITPSQHTSSASHIYHGIRFNQLNEESLKQEIAIWSDYFIPKNKAYENGSIDPSKPLKIGFVIGSSLALEWKTIVRPLINEIAKMGHHINVYWHQSGILPISKSPEIIIKNCRSVSDANFARLCRETLDDVLIDVGGMHTQTRERAFGINLAKKQYAWLVHAGIFSTPLLESLDKKLGNYHFAINPVEHIGNSKKKEISSMPRNSIAAIGCEAGLSLNTIQIWAKIVKQSSKKLVLDVQRKSIQSQLIKRFAKYGVTEKSIAFADNIEFKAGHLVLDNLDYNAIAKASSALISGANLITLTGELFPSKRTTNLLLHTNNHELVCDNEKDYIQLAMKLIDSKKKNTKIKTQIKDSGITDFKEFAKHFVNTLA